MKVLAAIKQQQTSVKFFIISMKQNKILQEIFTFFSKWKTALHKWKVQCQMIGRIEHNAHKYKAWWIHPEFHVRLERQIKYSFNFFTVSHLNCDVENAKQIIHSHLAVSAKNHATKSVFNKFVQWILAVQHKVRFIYKHQSLQLKLLERSFDKESWIMVKFI